MIIARRSDSFTHTLWFMRHGATQPNLDGVRCGGDHDVPLVPVGREQILLSAQHLSTLDLGIQRIVCSHLMRTAESARIVSRVLGGIPVELDDGFRERRLGEWNLQPLQATEALLRSRATPPGGEPSEAFSQRILDALTKLTQRHGNTRILILGSKGVARVLRESLGSASERRARERAEGLPASARNGEVLAFDLGALPKALSAQHDRMAEGVGT